MRRRWGQTAPAIAALAIGLGLATSIYSIVDALLLQPLPYRDPSRLVVLWAGNPSLGLDREFLSPAEFEQWRERTDIFESLVGFTTANNVFRDVEPVSMAHGTFFTPGFFDLIGLDPAWGRRFSEEEERTHDAGVVVLRHELWQRLFQADLGVLGRSVRLARGTVRVVGVMPPGFNFFNRQTQFFGLARAAPSERTRERRRYRVVGRLAEGVSLAQARTRAEYFATQLAQQRPETNRGWTVSLITLASNATEQVRPAALMLSFATAILLLVACANVGNLLLVQGVARAREFALRSAIGADRGRLLRQLLTESSLLAVIGGAAGLVLAWLFMSYFTRILPDPLSQGRFLVQLDAIRLDSESAWFAGGAGLLSAALFGVVPAWRASRPDLVETLKEGGRSSSVGRRNRAVLNGLVVGQVALAMLLSVGAVLLARSFSGLYHKGPGFNPDRAASIYVEVPGWQWDEVAEDVEDIYEQRRLRLGWLSAQRKRVLEQIRAVPGIIGASAADDIPLTGYYRTGEFTIEGLEDQFRRDHPLAINAPVGPEYFSVMGMPLLEGRGFETQEPGVGPRHAVVNREMARRFWPNESPVGKRIRGAGPDFVRANWFEVIGMVGDVHEDGLDRPPLPTWYLNFERYGARRFHIIYRADRDPGDLLPAVSAAIRSVQTEIPVHHFWPLEDMVLDFTWELRYSMLFLTLLAGLSLLLASIGVFGAMSQTVGDRVQEIGVRRALGAQPQSVFGMVMWEGFRLVLIGIVLGLTASAILTRYISSLLFGVEPIDPATFAGAAAVLAAAGMLAAVGPSLRALRIQPVEALRNE